jgi:hypothetical protein
MSERYDVYHLHGPCHGLDSRRMVTGRKAIDFRRLGTTAECPSDQGMPFPRLALDYFNAILYFITRLVVFVLRRDVKVGKALRR